jgi:hypothetical protein
VKYVDSEYRRVQSTKGQEGVQNAGGNRMYYNYHPWIKDIEYPMSDFTNIFILYGVIILAGFYFWDKSVYERYVNER